METIGGIYRWQRGTAKNQIYLQTEQLRKGNRVPGRPGIARGILRSEVIYGLAEEGGGGFRVQGATDLAGVYWNADFILLQESYPFPNLSPLTNTQGGAYQYSIRGDKLFTSEKRLNFGYSHSANNLDGSAERARRSQSLQFNMTGVFAPDFGWLLGYNGGIVDYYGRSEQHLLRMGSTRE